MKKPNFQFDNQENPYIRGVVAGALLTGVLFFFYLGGVMLSEDSGKKDLTSRTPAHSKNDIVHKKAIDLVNENLQMDEKLKELRALGVEVKNEEHLRQIREKLSEYQAVHDNKFGIDVVVDDGSAAVLEDIEAPANLYDSQMTPEEKIEMKMMQRREIAAFEHQQRLQYVRNFLENARKNGYEIILNDKLEVVRINRVRGDEPYRGEDSISDLFE